MGMTVVKGSRPTLAEAKTAKNYLYEDELKTLNGLVSAYLDLAELQALHEKAHVHERLDCPSGRLPPDDGQSGRVLQNASSVSHALAEQKAEANQEWTVTRDDVTPVEVAFLDSVEQQAKQLKK